MGVIDVRIMTTRHYNDKNDLLVLFLPRTEVETHPLTKEFIEDQTKIASVALLAPVLIPLAAHVIGGALSAVATRSKKTQVLDLERSVLLQGVYDEQGGSVLDEGYLVFAVGGTYCEKKKDFEEKDQPSVLGIWKLIASDDGTAIRMVLKKWYWSKFLQTPELSWTCQSIRFRDVAITVDIDAPGTGCGPRTVASWEFVFTSVTEGQLSTLFPPEYATEWRAAPPKPQASLMGDEYSVPANIRVNVVETTRPNILAPLLEQGAKAAVPLSKLVQSRVSK